MEIWPAIDIRGGKCVRLQQGDYKRETVFASDPAAMARLWVDLGARRLHLVDLDGAREGRPSICQRRGDCEGLGSALRTRRRSAQRLWHPGIAQGWGRADYHRHVGDQGARLVQADVSKISQPAWSWASMPVMVLSPPRDGWKLARCRPSA